MKGAESNQAYLSGMESRLMKVTVFANKLYRLIDSPANEMGYVYVVV